MVIFADGYGVRTLAGHDRMDWNLARRPRSLPDVRRGGVIAMLAAVVAALVVASGAAGQSCGYGTCLTAQTRPATAIAATSAELNATVNPGGQPATYHFDIGPTTAYGASTAEASAGAGAADLAVSATAGSLAPGTTYHFRVVARDVTGATVNGGDLTFTTPGASAAPPAPSGSGAGGAVAPLRVTAAAKPARDRTAPFRYRVRGRVVRPANVAMTACRGRVRVRLTQGRRVRARRTASLGPSCRFSKRLTARHLSGSSGRLRVRVRFLGNAALTARSAPGRTVRFG
jgi:hypothetical protein